MRVRDVLRRNDGSALAMIIIVSTISIMLLTTLANLAYFNLKYSRTTNKKSNSYYVADLGMEKTIKEIETIVESAKNYANTNVRSTNKSYTTPTPEIMSPYQHLLKYGDIETFKQDYIEYYNQYLTDARFQKAAVDFAEGSLVGYSDLPNAKYKSEINTATFNSQHKINILVTGNDNGKFERKIDVELGLNPWGYDSNGVAINPDAGDIDLNEKAIYESQQWANAISSSGDVVIRGGSTSQVRVNGNIYVNGKVVTPTGNEVIDGMNYGGLIVGKHGQSGHLTVNGNVISNNYVHTMAPNSTLNVNTTSQSAISDIYNIHENATYLNSNSSDPLNLGSNLIGSLGKKQAFSGNKFKDFINYSKETYKIQKQNGGFVYAHCIQVEQDATGSSINIAGSAIVFDNLAINGQGTINIDNNFYGFKYGGSTYNDSSSIVINDKNGVLNLNGRVYTGSTAYVTAFDSNGIPYQTSESISLFKNYYGYRIPISPYDDGAPSKLYSPFNFLDLAPNNKLRHVFAYYDSVLGDTISNGGLAYDTSMIKLNALYNNMPGRPLYDINQLSNASYDMGYTQGVLMGKNRNNADFIGVINPEVVVLTPMRKSQGGLTDRAFQNYISHKYSTLMQTKALMADNGKVVTINQLVDNSSTSPIHGWNKIYPDTPSPTVNYVVVDGDLTIGASGGRMTANGTRISDNLTYNGLILATGRITINTESHITINGAIISTTNPNNVGVEFLGGGNKTINFDKNVLVNIYKLPGNDQKRITEYLTTQRGVEKIFNEAYTKNWIPGFVAGVNAYVSNNPSVSTPEEAIKEIADLYEIVNSDFMTNEKIVLGSGIINTTIAYGSRNYKILKWNTIK